MSQLKKNYLTNEFKGTPPMRVVDTNPITAIIGRDAREVTVRKVWKPKVKLFTFKTSGIAFMHSIVRMPIHGYQ